MSSLEAVKATGFDDDFIRMWEFYLAYCEGGFRERIIGTVQLAFAKPGYRFQRAG
jgi:cyclopropane-fatty-acyl-phospholipid synthase